MNALGNERHEVTDVDVRFCTVVVSDGVWTVVRRGPCYLHNRHIEGPRAAVWCGCTLPCPRKRRSESFRKEGVRALVSVSVWQLSHRGFHVFVQGKDKILIFRAKVGVGRLLYRVSKTHTRVSAVHARATPKSLQGHAFTHLEVRSFSARASPLGGVDGCCRSRSHLPAPRRDRATRRGRGQPTGEELGAEADAGICAEGDSPSSAQLPSHAERVDDGSG